MGAATLSYTLYTIHLKHFKHAIHFIHLKHFMRYTLYTLYTLYPLYTLYIIHTREKGKFARTEREQGKWGDAFWIATPLGNQTACTQA